MVLFPLRRLNTISAGAFSGLDRPACEIAADVHPARTPYFFEVDFFFDSDFFFAEVFFRGTFPPSFRASDNPIAIACFWLVTFLPDRPLLSVPSFLSCIAFSTFLEAFLPYLAMAFFCFEFVLDLRLPANRLSQQDKDRAMPDHFTTEMNEVPATKFFF
jgi:hypothetical protein